MRGFIICVVLFLAGCGPAPHPYAKAPGVASVEETGSGPRCLIHVLDWRFVPKDRYLSEGVSGPGVDELYEEFLVSVETVQKHQIDFLRYLIENEELTEIHLEGVTAENLASWEADLAAIKDAAASGDDPHRLDRLKLGAGGKLAQEGKLTVKPAEDDKAYHAARPDDSYNLDEEAKRRRESAICEEVLAGKDFAVVILEGTSNLADNLPPGVRYIRIKVKDLPE